MALFMGSLLLLVLWNVLVYESSCRVRAKDSIFSHFDCFHLLKSTYYDRSSLISADSSLHTPGAAAGLELSSGASPIPQHPTDKRRLLFINMASTMLPARDYLKQTCSFYGITGDNYATPCGAPCNNVRRSRAQLQTKSRIFPISSAA
ncbi:hypothetical protein R3P38DRAFT_328600 [Favolaschia claudopus]|uniref:Uncharacterized protein n=1 Tax=Favolaschia claudopus TaxID=2862362 RepID=A0AAV9ZMR2_9AGAR